MKLPLFAYLGLDEYGSGAIGIKQARVPAGMIPLVTLEQPKLERPYILEQLERQSQFFGKKIYFCRYEFTSVLWTTRNGQRWDE